MRYLVSGLILVLLLMTGCAGPVKEYESPTVNITSLKSLRGQPGAPRFEIGLQIINPNESALVLDGMSYTLHLEGHKVLTGVANDLPEIAAYGEADITLQASVDVFSSIRLISDLLSTQRKQFRYALEAKLDPAGLRPNIYVTREGVIALKDRQTAL